MVFFTNSVGFERIILQQMLVLKQFFHEPFFHFSGCNCLYIIIFATDHSNQPNCNDPLGSLHARQKWALGNLAFWIITVRQTKNKEMMDD